MAKHRRDHEASGGETSTGHLGAPRQAPPISEQLPCLVVRATADGYVVGRALIDASAVTWMTPTHVRPWQETRPVDVRIPALREANIGGSVELKPARTAKGVPVLTTVGTHVVFGENIDSAAQRARLELRKQFDAMVKGRRTYWRHLCKEQLVNETPKWLGTPRGEACPHCDRVEPKPKASAA